MIIERGKPIDGYGKPVSGVWRAISLCSPEQDPVTRLDTDRFQVHLTDFIPRSERHIGFFGFDPAASGRKPKSVEK